MVDIQWGILERAMAQPSIGERFQAGMDQGRMRSALGDLRRDPGNTNALNALMEVNPALGIQMETRAARLAEQQRVATGRNALADYLLGGDERRPLQSGVGLTPPPQTITSPESAPPTTGATNALTQSPPGFGVDAATARERALRADPEAFLQGQNAHLAGQRQRVQLSQEQFDLMRDINEQTLQLLGGIGQVPEGQRQQAWDAALARAEGLYSRFGMNVRDHVPAQYDPASYDQLMRSAMKTREQFAVMNAENRLDWDIQDDEADNARADRGMDSLIGYREGRLGLMARGQDMTDARVRRGQDIGSSDRRYGQNLSSRDRRRGQDIGSRDRQRGQDIRGSGSRRGGSGGGNGARAMLNGRAIVVRGGRWVDEQTGRAVQ